MPIPFWDRLSGFIVKIYFSLLTGLVVRNNLTDNLADNLTDILRTPSMHSITPKRHCPSLCGRRCDSDSAFWVGLSR